MGICEKRSRIFKNMKLSWELAPRWTIRPIGLEFIPKAGFDERKVRLKFGAQSFYHSQAINKKVDKSVIFRGFRKVSLDIVLYLQWNNEVLNRYSWNLHGESIQILEKFHPSLKPIYGGLSVRGLRESKTRNLRPRRKPSSLLELTALEFRFFFDDTVFKYQFFSSWLTYIINEYFSIEKFNYNLLVEVQTLNRLSEIIKTNLCFLNFRTFFYLRQIFMWIFRQIQNRPFYKENFLIYLFF